MLSDKINEQDCKHLSEGKMSPILTYRELYFHIKENCVPTLFFSYKLDYIKNNHYLIVKLSLF